MTGRPSAYGHVESVDARRASSRPGSPPLANPAGSSGDAGERDAFTWLSGTGLDVVSKPGVAGYDDSGRGIRPDLAAHVGLGTPTRIVKGRQIDVFVEVKRQERGGSTIDKIPYTITRYATLSDRTGMPALLLHDFDETAASTGVLEHLQALADMHLVGFCRIGSLSGTELIRMLQRIVRDRARRLNPAAEVEQMLAALDPLVVAQLYRRAVRRDPLPVPAAALTGLLD